MEGYGIYWFIIEQLALSGGILPLKIIPVLSMQMQSTETKVRGVVEQFELFQIVDNDFFSRRLNIHLELRQTLSKSGKEGAKNRWANGGANSLPNAKERKESKGKEIKEIKEKKESKHISVSDETDKRWNLWVESWFNFYTAKVGIKPSFTGAEPKALKTIRKYLSENCPGENSPDENGLTAWNQILDNWQCQDQWMITQLELKIISSKINIVLTNIKKHSDAKQFKSAPINNLSNTAKELDEYFAKRYPKQQSDAG